MAECIWLFPNPGVYELAWDCGDVVFLHDLSLLRGNADSPATAFSEWLPSSPVRRVAYPLPWELPGFSFTTVQQWDRYYREALQLVRSAPTGLRLQRIRPRASHRLDADHPDRKVLQRVFLQACPDAAALLSALESASQAHDTDRIRPPDSPVSDTAIEADTAHTLLAGLSDRIKLRALETHEAALREQHDRVRSAWIQQAEKLSELQREAALCQNTMQWATQILLSLQQRDKT